MAPRTKKPGARGIPRAMRPKDTASASTMRRIAEPPDIACVSVSFAIVCSSLHSPFDPDEVDVNMISL